MNSPAMMSDVMINVSKMQLIVALLLQVGAPIAAGFTAYQKSHADIRVQLEEIRVEREKDFVRKDDMRIMMEKLDIIGQRISNIEGFLRKQ